MTGSLFNNKTEKSFKSLEKRRDRLEAQKKSLVEKAMQETHKETFEDVFDVVNRYGHPIERNQVKDIENKYWSGEDLNFDDLANLNRLYKSNLENFSNKDLNNE